MGILVLVLYVLITVALALAPFYVLVRRFRGKRKKAQLGHLVGAYLSSLVIFGVIFYLTDTAHRWIKYNVVNSYQLLDGLGDGLIVLIPVLSLIFIILPSLSHKYIGIPSTSNGVIPFTLLSIIGLVVGYLLLFYTAFSRLNYESFP